MPMQAQAVLFTVQQMTAMMLQEMFNTPSTAGRRMQINTEFKSMTHLQVWTLEMLKYLFDSCQKYIVCCVEKQCKM